MRAEAGRHGQELGRSWIKHDGSAISQLITVEEDILEHKEGIECKHDVDVATKDESVKRE
jgi:hypothetical protein